MLIYVFNLAISYTFFRECPLKSIYKTVFRSFIPHKAFELKSNTMREHCYMYTTCIRAFYNSTISFFICLRSEMVIYANKTSRIGM